MYCKRHGLHFRLATILAGCVLEEMERSKERVVC